MTLQENQIHQRQVVLLGKEECLSARHILTAQIPTDSQQMVQHIDIVLDILNSLNEGITLFFEDLNYLAIWHVAIKRINGILTPIAEGDACPVYKTLNDELAQCIDLILEALTQIEEYMTIHVTPLEEQVIKNILSSEYMDAEGDQIAYWGVWTFSVTNEDKQLAGALGSLIQKGMCFNEDASHDNACGLTERGYLWAKGKGLC